MAALMSVPRDASVLSIPKVEAASLPDFHTFASTTAQKYGQDPELFAKVIGCESHWRPDATSTTADFGIAQWHLASHPEITMDEALNPYWSIENMARAWQAGHARWWVCYNKLYGNPRP